MPEEQTNTQQIMAELEQVSALMQALSHPLRAEDVNDLGGAVSYLARVLVMLVEECAAQPQKGAPDA